MRVPGWGQAPLPCCTMGFLPGVAPCVHHRIVHQLEGTKILTTNIRR